MLIAQLSSDYLVDNYSDYTYYIYNDEEDFLVFVVCDELEHINYGYKISKIFSRTFCNEVYNSRYITNMKNLIDVGFVEALNSVYKFLQEKNIECDKLNISINGGVYRNGKLMLFSLGKAPIFIIDRNCYLYCPFNLDEYCDLKNWKKYIKYKVIEQPRAVIACSSKLNGKLFKYIKNDNLEVKPYKYKILELVNFIITNKNNLKKIKKVLNKKLDLDLSDDIPLLLISFDETPINEALLKAERPKLNHKKLLKIPNITQSNIDMTYFKNKKINYVGVVATLVILIILMSLLVVILPPKSSDDNSDNNIITNGVLNSSNSKLNNSNTNLEPIGFSLENNSMLNKSINSINDSLKDNIENKKRIIEAHNNKTDKKNLNQHTYNDDSNPLKIFVKFLGYANNSIKLSITYPEKGYYDVLICSKDRNLKLLGIKDNHCYIIYKNETQFELFEKITEKEMNYTLRVSKGDTQSVKDELIISISKIEIK